jgi:transcriptional regulator with XRE-family HTH domain
VVSEFGNEVRRLLAERGMSLHQVAKATHYDVSYLSKVVNGHKPGSRELAEALDKVLDTDGVLAAMAPDKPVRITAGDDETDAWELARLATASDVGPATLDRIDQAVDELAVAYPGTPPGVLLARVRRHLGYVARLLDARKTLAEHKRLLVAGGWLSLLAATTCPSPCLAPASLMRRPTSPCRPSPPGVLSRRTTGVPGKSSRPSRRAAPARPRPCATRTGSSAPWTTATPGGR